MYYNELENILYNYIHHYTLDTASDGEKWSLYRRATVVNDVSVGAARAFSHYLVELRKNEEP